jgi:hypothetical protein
MEIEGSPLRQVFHLAGAMLVEFQELQEPESFLLR